jgi:DNA processing protein
MALEAGRDVFAIPGSIHSPQARGCHALIKQGAKLVDRAEDVLEELSQGSSAVVRPATPPPEEARHRDTLLEALGGDPITLESLFARTARSAADLQAHLLDLELTGRVARLPGQLFQRLIRG